MREGLIISGMLVQVRAVPKRRSTHISNYQSNERKSYEHDETSMTEIPVCPRERFPPIRLCSGLSLAIKGIGTLPAPLLLLVTFHLLRFTSLHHHLLPLLSVLAVITLLKTVYQSLLLLVGFDTLTYQKDYD